MPRIKLLPCPFCGTQVTNKDILSQENKEHPKFGWLILRCWECGVQVSEVTGYKSQIAAKWNHRVKVVTL